MSKSHGISLFGGGPALIPDHNQQLKRRRGNPETGFDPGSDHLQSSQGGPVACFDGVKFERCNSKIILLISLTVKGRVYIQLIEGAMMTAKPREPITHWGLSQVLNILHLIPSVMTHDCSTTGCPKKLTNRMLLEPLLCTQTVQSQVASTPR